LRREAGALEGFDQRLAHLQEKHGGARQTYLTAAAALSAARHEAAERFVRQLERLLADLAMERSRFEIRFAPQLGEGAWTAGGLDRAELFVSPNAGEELRPLARIASGGELSRIMMAIKTLTSTSRHGFSEAFQRQPSSSAPGLIFDEVDAGIGGRVADVVGRKLRALGSAFQVLCITHLPQIAAHADTHFSISKRVDEGRTKTSVARLDDAGRVQEISRMLGGEAITAAIETSAREMIAGRRAATASGGPERGAKDERTSKGESERGGSGRRATRERP
jgi:DNA repair protein RecN (Recombination protein N)